MFNKVLYIIEMITEEQGAADTVAELPTSQFTAINRKEQRTMAISFVVDRESRGSKERWAAPNVSSTTRKFNNYNHDKSRHSGAC